MLTESWRVICESLRTSVRGVGLLGLGLCALPALAASPAAGQTRESAPVNGSPSKLADAIRPFWINIPESKLVDLRHPRPKPRKPRYPTDAAPARPPFLRPNSAGG